MRGDDLAKALPRAAVLLTGVVYIFGAWKCAMPLRELNPHWLMYGLLVNWTGDMGAYYVVGGGPAQDGAAGKPQQILGRSGGIVAASVLIAGAYLLHFVPWIATAQVVALTIAANAAGQLGDLAESAIKRGAGLKDSGAILPGHGGFLTAWTARFFPSR